MGKTVRHDMLSQSIVVFSPEAMQQLESSNAYCPALVFPQEGTLNSDGSFTFNDHYSELNAVPWVLDFNSVVLFNASWAKLSAEQQEKLLHKITETEYGRFTFESFLNLLWKHASFK